jgi:hypothetical protein
MGNKQKAYNMEKQTEIISALKTYILSGYSCLPVQQNKSPMPGKLWKDGIDNPAEYAGAYGLGIVCGSQSGGLECIDFDNHFGDAKEVLSEFIQIDVINELYRKYKFPIESTMNGGFHLLYRCEEMEGNLKLARRAKWDEETRKYIPDVIIETRGEGGYFVSAPTPGYKVIRNDINEVPKIGIEDRNIIISICKSFNTWQDREQRIADDDSTKPGNVYNESREAIIDAKICLEQHGWSEIRAGYWRRPNKKEGISATFGKVADNVFYVFSTNAHPFEDRTGYKPFGIIGLLDYNGNFKDYAKVLAEKYGDTRQEKPKKKKQDPPATPLELDNILRKAYIDILIPVAKPPIAMKIKGTESGFPGMDSYQRLFTLGNFSAITGKGKSKKTFLTSLLLAAASKNGYIQDKFQGTLPENKRSVLLFDTEQSGYDAWVTSKRVKDIVGRDIENFGSFDLREYDPLKRCEIIEHALKTFSPRTGFVVIDGIADLSRAINDEEEATRVGSLLMKWTKIYDVHIVTVIHQNKGDNYATGHLGSMIIKKAEAVIGVAKDNYDKFQSIVTCDNMRGAPDFDDFAFDIDSRGMPRISANFTPADETTINM